MKDFAQNCQACGVEHTSSTLSAIKISGYTQNLQVCASCVILNEVVESYKDAANLIISAFDTNTKVSK